MPKKESEQFGDSNHKGIFKKILNKLIIIRDYEKKLLIKNKSIASEGYHDSNDKLDERISALRGIMFDPIALIFGVLGECRSLKTFFGRNTTRQLITRASIFPLRAMCRDESTGRAQKVRNPSS